MKAHLTKQQSEARGQLELWRGNVVADSTARGRAEAALPPETVCSLLNREAKTRLGFLRGSARLLAAYPRPSMLADLPNREVAAKADTTVLVLFNGHEMAWAPHRNRWVCLSCSHSSGNLRKRDFAEQPCSGNISAVLACSVGAKASGHEPRYAFVQGSNVPIVCCIRCGCYSKANSNVIGLARKCTIGGPPRQPVGA